MINEHTYKNSQLDEPGFVYAASKPGGNIAKIGCTHNLKNRIFSLRSFYKMPDLNYIHISPRYRKKFRAEYAYHAYFSEFLDSNEWFRVPCDILRKGFSVQAGLGLFDLANSSDIFNDDVLLEPGSVLSQDEVTSIIDYLTKNSRLLDLAIFALSYYAALWPREISELQWANVINRLNKIDITPCFWPDENMARPIRMHSKLQAILSNLKADQLTWNSNPIHVIQSPNFDWLSSQSIKTRILNIYRDVGLTNCTEFTARKSFIIRAFTKVGFSRDTFEIIRHITMDQLSPFSDIEKNIMDAYRAYLVEEG